MTANPICLGERLTIEATMLTRDTKKEKHCIICGCTEHRLIGCPVHWIRHRRNESGICSTIR
jgi:hypothetical protein